jgi:cell wall-associated NlpC family hydrolase
MNLNAYVGLPYEEGARGPDRFDCYGIVAAVFAERGITLPDFYQREPGPMSAARAIDASVKGEILGGRAERVQEPEDYDIVVVRGFSKAHHVGVVMSGGVLHASRGLGSIWQSLSSFKMLHGDTEFYRWHI